MGRGLVALTPPGSHAGPIHAVLADPLPPLQVGTAVRVEADRALVGESLVIDVSGAEGLERRPSPAGGALGGAVAGQPIGGRHRGTIGLAAPPYRSRCADWCTPLADQDIARVAGLLCGVGPGLTPSGDDALAGVLFVARLLWGVTAEPHLLACLGEARTSEPSITFLVWAARGQSLAPAHELLLAAADGRVDEGHAERGATGAGGCILRR